MHAPSAKRTSVELRRVERPADLAVARELFFEYAASLKFSPCLQGFDAEVASLPDRHAQPDGQLLLAWVAGEPAGCVGLRRLDPTACELKRLYVRPSFRGNGVGRLLARAAIAEARSLRYQRIQLDTLPSMQAAISLYEGLGFVRIAPECANPSDCALCFELQL